MEENISVSSPINCLLSKNLDDIIDMYIYFKESLSPCFLEHLKTSVPFTQFILNILYNEKMTMDIKVDKDELYFEIFKEEYSDDISLSYKFINSFLISREKSINKMTWELFCYKYTM